MSRKGNCSDNSPSGKLLWIFETGNGYGENFNSYDHLKNEIENILDGTMKMGLNKN